jgi:hypothetical protein
MLIFIRNHVIGREARRERDITAKAVEVKARRAATLNFMMMVQFCIERNEKVILVKV